MPQAGDLNSKFRVQNKLSSASLLLIGVLLFSLPLFAHHGTSVYDNSKTVTVKGTVTDYVWTNPHVYVKVDDADDSGNTVHWILEAQNPLTEAEVGWSKNTFKPGDQVEVEVKPARNGRSIGSIGFTARIIINGKQFKP